MSEVIWSIYRKVLSKFLYKIKILVLNFKRFEKIGPNKENTKIVAA